ncbi:hypothetical protein PC128_g20421 [Phytophthora cactorum]|nr:hypothetical protein PC128_g20421 [Phytophthora cactorum]
MACRTLIAVVWILNNCDCREIDGGNDTLGNAGHTLQSWTSVSFGDRPIDLSILVLDIKQPQCTQVNIRENPQLMDTQPINQKL